MKFLARAVSLSDFSVLLIFPLLSAVCLLNAFASFIGHCSSVTFHRKHPNWYAEDPVHNGMQNGDLLSYLKRWANTESKTVESESSESRVLCSASITNNFKDADKREDQTNVVEVWDILCGSSCLSAFGMHSKRGGVKWGLCITW